MIQAGSQVNNKFEKNYKATEGEALAVSIALDRCKYFIQGTPITIITDHAPLVGIEKSEITEKTTSRILRIKEKWQNYNITIQYIRGEDNVAADALSRHIDGLEAEEDSEDLLKVESGKEEEACNCIHINSSAKENPDEKNEAEGELFVKTVSAKNI